VSNESEQRFVIERLDENDPAAVYDWCFETCKTLDLEFLAEQHNTKPDRERVAKAIAGDFPKNVRESALQGCFDGFTAQDEAGGPMPRPASTQLRDDSGELWLPQYNLGGAVAAELLVAHSATAAVVVRHIAAEPRGWSFELIVRLREPVNDLFRHVETLHYVPKRRKPDCVYIEVRLADGRIISPPVDGTSAELPVLQSVGGSGGREGWRQEFWVPGLPPEGPVTFAVTWETRGIENATATLDSALLHEAASNAQPLWT
jgi:hypothetical protein